MISTEDRLAIGELVAKFCHYSDYGDWEKLASLYTPDIVTEMETRLESPQAMLLVVPNGKVKLLNALPFSPADLRRDSLAVAWAAYREAWRAPQVREFILRCRSEPAFLRHANETWPVPAMVRG